MTSDPSNSARIVAEVLVGEDSIPEYVTARWVARVFGISRRTVIQAINAGTLPATRDDTHTTCEWRIKPSDAVLRWGYRLTTGTGEES